MYIYKHNFYYLLRKSLSNTNNTNFGEGESFSLQETV